MKKNLLTTAALSLLLTTGIASAQSNYSVGEIEFKGEVTTASCSLNPIAPVDLGSVSTREFSESGKVGGWGKTVIEFVNCDMKTDTNADGIEGITLTIQQGAVDPVSSELWANTTGTATGVGIRVKVDNQIIKPDGSAQGIKKSSFRPDGSLTYDVYGQMESVDVATAGKVATTVSFIANYK